MAGVPRSQGRANPKVGPSDSSDSFADRPDRSTDTDDGGTGERATVGKVNPPRAETGTDRVARDQDVGLGGGLDQAEEARLGTTDEERMKQAEDEKLKPSRKSSKK